MRLVVDTSVLVGELLRARGREWLADDRLELFMPEQMWGEAQAELPRRIRAFMRRRKLDSDQADELSTLCLEAVESNVVILEEAIYAALEDEAVARSLRDPGDWPVVACAVALSAAVLTNDNDFLGTGVPTWTTETLQGWLERRVLAQVADVHGGGCPVVPETAVDPYAPAGDHVGPAVGTGGCHPVLRRRHQPRFDLRPLQQPVRGGRYPVAVWHLWPITERWPRVVHASLLPHRPIRPWLGPWEVRGRWRGSE